MEEDLMDSESTRKFTADELFKVKKKDTRSTWAHLHSHVCTLLCVCLHVYTSIFVLYSLLFAKLQNQQESGAQLPPWRRSQNNL